MRRITLRCWAAVGAALLMFSTAAPVGATDHRWAPAMEMEDGDHLTRPAMAAPGQPDPVEIATPKGAGQADPVKITAPSAILIESKSGRVLYQKNAHERRNPASVTKIMTLIVAFDALRDGKVKLDDPVTVSDEAAKQIGTIIFADTGETFKFEELLLSVAVGSANDAAVSVAEHVAGSVDAFVQMMNDKARELGMNDTQFMNPTGLSADGHMTSAYDIALMSRYAANNYPELMKLTAIYGADLKVPWRKNGPVFRLWNNNKLLTWYQGADGLKTGWTEAAGYCLAATAVRNGVRMISVIMGSDSPKVRNAEAARLLEGYETPEVVEGLVGVLDDDSAEVRDAAAVSLSELKEASMGDGLLAALTAASSPFKLAALFRALRELRRAEAFAPALAALASDDVGVRCAALGVLGYLKNPEALPDIARLAGSDPDVEARRIAVGALGFATELDAVVPAMKRALVDASWQVREEAAATLGKLLAGGVVDDLVAAMADPYWQVRIKAARSLGRLKAKPALPVLIEALGHEISNLRKEAAVALGEVGDVAAIPALEKALDDPDPDVRKLARLALTQLSK